MPQSNGFWTFETEAAAKAALPSATWDTPVELRDGRWAFVAYPNAVLPVGAMLITGLAAMMAGAPLRGMGGAS